MLTNNCVLWYRRAESNDSLFYDSICWTPKYSPTSGWVFVICIILPNSPNFSFFFSSLNRINLKFRVICKRSMGLLMLWLFDEYWALSKMFFDVSYCALSHIYIYILYLYNIYIYNLKDLKKISKNKGHSSEIFFLFNAFHDNNWK